MLTNVIPVSSHQRQACFWRSFRGKHLQLLQAVPYDAKHLMMQRMKRRHFRFFMGKDLQMLQVVPYDVKHLMGQHVKPLMTCDRTVRVHVIKKKC